MDVNDLIIQKCCYKDLRFINANLNKNILLQISHKYDYNIIIFRQYNWSSSFKKSNIEVLGTTCWTSYALSLWLLLIEHICTVKYHFSYNARRKNHCVKTYFSNMLNATCKALHVLPGNSRGTDITILKKMIFLYAIDISEWPKYEHLTSLLHF